MGGNTLTTDRMRLVAAYAAAAFSITIWGATPAATQIAAAEIDAFTTGLLRTVLAAAVTLPLAWFAGFPRPATAREWKLLAISAFGGFIGFTLLFNVAVPMTTTSHAALVIASAPVFTGSIAALVDRRMPKGRWWLGVAIALAGEAALIGFRGGLEAKPGALTGDLLCLLAIVIATSGYVAGSRLTSSIGTWGTTFWAIGLAGIVQLPLVWVFLDKTDWASVSLVGWSATLYLAFLSTMLGYVGWYYALAKGGVVRMAPLQFSQPLVAIVIAPFLFNETITIQLLLSGAAIVGGIAIATKK